MLWISHNNKPLEEAAKTLHAWTSTPVLEKLSCLADLFRRVVAFKLPTTVPELTLMSLPKMTGNMLGS
jgi:hypothetical protein